VWLVFVAYCLLASAAWVVAPFGDGTSFFERQVILFVLVGAVAIAFSWRELRTVASSLPWVGLVIAGVSFWGVPACLIHWVGGGISSVVISATFALLPAVVALMTAIGGMTGDKGEGWGFFTPALAGFGGALLLLPVGLPESVREQLMLAVVFGAVTVGAGAGVWMYRLLKGEGFGLRVAIVCFANAAFLTICGLLAGGFGGGWSGLAAMLSISSGIDLIQIAMVFWLLREMSPVRFAIRYLVIPLLTLVEGYIVLRPELTARMVVGAALLVGGTAWILFSKTSDEDIILSFR
jgi:drug/metabolite transporter (DMT)-like permease